MMFKKYVRTTWWWPPALVLVCGPFAGCRMGVPIHVWQPPTLESTVGKRVAVAEVTGPAEIARAVQEGLIKEAPSDPGRATRLIPANELQSKTSIQLVNFIDEQPSDVALAAIAGSEGYDFMLQGHVLQAFDPTGGQERDQRLSLSWRLVSLADKRSAGGQPLVIDYETAIERYPDLGVIADRQTAMAMAASRRTMELITPSVQRDRIQLAIPYLLPGSKQVREGNLAAMAGRWDEARRIWGHVAERHPTQVAALHNLAIAEAAAQNFSLAKQLARKAIRRQPTKLHQQTLVWIELRQRDYHRSFGLPDPPEGWFLTQSPVRIDSQ